MRLGNFKTYHYEIEEPIVFTHFHKHMCSAKSPYGWYCTREYTHVGFHEAYATGNLYALARWSDDPHADAESDFQERMFE